MAALLSPGRNAGEPKLIIKSRDAVPALLLGAGSSRKVVPALSLEQQLRDDVAAEAHALRQRRDDVVAALDSRRAGPGDQAEDAAARSGLDTTVAHQARIYDYWLGGKDNFAVDREAAEQAIAAYRAILRAVRAQPAFLASAVRFLAERGLRQFLDIGAGIPTANNAHEVAQAAAPEARIVYVDNDPMVLAHARAPLTSTTQGSNQAWWANRTSYRPNCESCEPSRLKPARHR